MKLIDCANPLLVKEFFLMLLNAIFYMKINVLLCSLYFHSWDTQRHKWSLSECSTLGRCEREGEDSERLWTKWVFGIQIYFPQFVEHLLTHEDWTYELILIIHHFHDLTAPGSSLAVERAVSWCSFCITVFCLYIQSNTVKSDMDSSNRVFLGTNFIFLPNEFLFYFF